ncbi:MAG TPA: helicase-related protein [Gammaproteobacteria bacterium]|nr:helicase-related protein [Gammaproteobacteria bacterium]
MSIVLLLKGGSGSGNRGHAGRPGKVGGSAPARIPQSSADIRNEMEAQRYFMRRFGGGRPMPVTVDYQGQKYPITVSFDSSHAYTARALGGARKFEPERARTMDYIPVVLRHPDALTWSQNDPRNKQYDKKLSAEDEYGRVVLRPIPTPEELADGYSRHFEFVSWHPYSESERFTATARSRHKTNPAKLRKLHMRKAAASWDVAALVKAHRVALARRSKAAREDAACIPIPDMWAEGLAPSDAGCGHRNAPGPVTNVSAPRFFFKSIPAGARWITVHPNGSDAKGQPVLVQEDKNGTYRVIGGAGGKLNYLKLRGVKSEKEYKQEAAQRQKAKREQRKQQRQKDKELGVASKKDEARESVRTQRVAAERQFIETVADAMGWDKDKLNFEAPEGLSEKAAAKAGAKHHRALLQQAREAVEGERKLLVESAARRTEAELGEIPLDATDPDTLSVQDLAPIQPHAGLGYSTNYGQRAESRGLTDAELAREKAAVEGEQDEETRERREARRLDAARIKDELKNFRTPDLGTDKAVDAKRAVELLKAQKALQNVQKEAQKANRKIDKDDAIEPKAYVLEVSGAEDMDERVQHDIENDLRTLKTRAFLSEVGNVGGADYEATLGRHIGVGAYNAVNSLSLATAGAALVDRDVVDVLGIAGAAQVLARRLQNDLTEEELAQAREALEAFHADEVTERSKAALDAAKQWTDAAKAVEIDAARTGHDLAEAQELNAQRREAIEKAQAIVGTALGEMESNAALVMALGQHKDEVQASLGTVSVDDAIRRARAIGLDRGDYQVAKVGANTFLTVSGAGMDKLAQPVNRADLEQVRGALDIIEGRADEDDWLPGGIANRPDLAMDTPAGSVPRMAEPFETGADLAQSIKDYIGGRTADGDPPAAILADLLSQDIVSQVGDQRDAYFDALDRIAPLKDADGKMIRAETHQKAFEKLADAFVDARYGNSRAPLHRQQIKVDQKAVDALHRSLAAHPAGIAAFKDIGDLDHHDQRALRDVFARDIAHSDPETQALRAKLHELQDAEPDREVEDMFGTGTNPAWTEWKQQRDGLAEQIGKSELTWPKYAKIMGGPKHAYAALQDVVRSKLLQDFHQHYNMLNPDGALKLGRTVVRGNLNHLDAVDPAAREKRLEQHRKMVDSLRERVAGRYASGAVSDKIERTREAMEAAQQSQMGFFASLPDEAAEKAIAPDERYTLGHAVERQIGGMMPIIGRNFKPDRPTRIWQASMNGRFINQQRAVKLIAHNKRLALAQGVGSGKTVIGLAGFTNLHEQGKVKRGLFLVPGIVQGQFSGEALRYLEPGKYKWAIDPGAGREQRIASYRDPETHFAVVTHQAFRDDMIHLGADQADITHAEMRAKLDAMTPAARKDWLRGVMDQAGISYDYLNVDEGHDLLNRAGKANSALANVVDALSANTPYYVNATADPIKNDASEAFDVLHKMDPARYADRAAFMRRYGVDTGASRDALRHEMARYFYPGRIDPGVQAKKREETVPLSGAQRTAVRAADEAAARARLARMRGKVDVEAVKALSPHSFDGVDTARHEAIAKRLQPHIGLLKQSAIDRALNGGADNAKTAKLVDIARDYRGRPGVVFARHRDAVEHIAEALRKEGHRVISITGADSAKDKDRKKLAFRPEQGEAEADILVCSDAAAVGLNAQRGNWLVQYDTPDTAKTHAQRNGRINRVGQKNDVDLIDLVADHPAERKARKRLAEKYDLRDIMTSPLEGLDDTGVAGYLNRVRAQHEQANLF